MRLRDVILLSNRLRDVRLSDFHCLSRNLFAVLWLKRISPRDKVRPAEACLEIKEFFCKTCLTNSYIIFHAKRRENMNCK